MVGGGWAGFGAAKALSEQGYAVTLLDAQKYAGGVSAGWRTSSGRPVEAGTKGFWWDYPNIFGLIDELGVKDALTPFLNSGFWNSSGEVITEAPVFSDQPQLPSIIGQFFYTNPLFYGLSIVDRLSIIPWLFNVFYLKASGETYNRYDQMSAYELFRLFGVTDKAYELFLKPTLAVGLFTNPEQLSAAAVLETLEFYALAHQNSFDVCWCKGSISERIFQPLIQRIEAQGGTVAGSRLVTDITIDPLSGHVDAVIAKNVDTGNEEVYEADAVVFAVSISGMQKLVMSNQPVLGVRRDFQNIMNLRTIDCIATRIWFDRPVITKFPVNVIAGIEGDVGCTYFNLSTLQSDEFQDEPGTVIAADFYGASSILPLTDEEIINRVQRNIAVCEPQFAGARVIDSAVLRFPKAVTHFSPGSLRYRPTQQTSIPNVFIAGDYVKGLEHGANGLSQERAFVSGLSAANLVIESQGVGSKVDVKPVAKEELHIALAKQASQQTQRVLDFIGLRLPFL